MERNLNEILKAKEEQEALKERKDEQMHLDDAARVKIISPGRLVAKRFARNRLAIVGSVILIVMFVFSFLCPIFYGWGQTEVDYKYDHINKNYALAKENSEYLSYPVGDSQVDSALANRMNTYISAMEKNGETSMTVFEDGTFYTVDFLSDKIYELNRYDAAPVCVFGSYTAKIGRFAFIGNTFTYEDGVESLGSGFEAAVAQATGAEFEYRGQTFVKQKADAPKTFDIYLKVSDAFTYDPSFTGSADFEKAAQAAADAGKGSFDFEEQTYSIGENDGMYVVAALNDPSPVLVSTEYYYVMQETGAKVSDEFRVNSLMAIAENKDFEADGASYTVGSEDGNPAIYDADGALYAELSTFVIRRYDGSDTMNYDLKMAILDTISSMEELGEEKHELVHELPKQSEEDGSYVLDDEGNYTYEDATLTINRRGNQEYVITCDMVNYLINNYCTPNAHHLLGTDADGYDVLARMMYGGRISLMVGFVVVILETILGVIMGGLAGYFGGAVDNIIMRLVDIFYCLPSMPILIILGAMMDAQRFSTYARLFVMMASLGIMGWAGIARLVRGQILSLREQDFMIAAEATGVRVSRRIFRHLVPNVMPQLIVTATSGLGGIIITESTLSFLGLGVKHPLATWGTMINSVSSQAALEHYYYIWIPVGLLICLTVIAFNFVGDGLRDAFDPKSKE